MPARQTLDLLSLPSSAEWWHFLLVFGGLVTTIGLGEGVRLLLRWSPEFTRKLVHISVGVLIFFAPAIFTTAMPALILAVSFIVINFLAIRLGLFKGMHGTTRPTYGTVFYPLAFLVLVLLFWYRAHPILSLSVLVMALGDAAAAVVGESLRSPTLYHLSCDKKSVEGSLTMFTVTAVIIGGGLMYFGLGQDRGFGFVVAVSLVAAMTATAWEALSSRGLDNLTVPLSTAFVLSVYVITGPSEPLGQFTVGNILGLLIAIISYRAGFLSLSGSVATYLLAATVYGLGGWKWTAPILVFFILSSILSKVGKARKARLSDVFEKGSTRDHLQVFANGGIAGIFAIIGWLFPGLEVYPLYLGAVAAVTADTWGTEIGVLTRGKTYLVTSWTPVPAGVNGGVSAAGFSGAFIGSAVIALTGLLWFPDPVAALLVTAAGFLGGFADSLLGATLQASYRCPVCGKVTEKRTHCGRTAAGGAPEERLELVRGYAWMGNDTVNWFCAASGALVMALSFWI